MRALKRALIAFTASTAFIGIAPPATAQPQAAPAGELGNEAKPVAYRLDLIVDPAKEKFSGRAEIDIDVAAPTSTLFLHGNELEVAKASVTAAGQAAVNARYSQVLTTGVARLDFDKPLGAGRHTLAIEYQAPFRPGAEGLYHIKVGDNWYAWTQMEPLDARRMFPSFDEPRHKTPFAVTITAPEGQRVYANAEEVGATPAGPGMVRHQFAPTLPLPTYLVAIAVGPFDQAEASIPPNAVRAKPLALRHIATKGQAVRLGYGLQQTPVILGMLEDYFGIAYPYSKLDQIASPVMGGAMENAGLITYDDTLLLLDPDAPLAQQRNFGTVVAHEIAHQWFGNLVTPRWWDDIWLNESFAEWMGNKVADKWRPELGAGVAQLDGALEAMNGDSQSVGRPIRQPIARNEDVGSAFDSITYEKGGQVLEMVEEYLGDEVFRRGVQAHLKRFPFGTATAEDFFASIGGAANDPRIIESFRSFVTQQGVPLVRFRREGDGYRISQERYTPIGVQTADKPVWKIPVCAVVGEARQCVMLEGKEAVLPGLAAEGEAHLIPNAGAAGYYRFDLEQADWDRLIAAGPRLGAEEAMIVADSIFASFQAGNIGFDRVLAAARALAGHSERLAATFIPYKIDQLGDAAMGVQERAAYGAFVGSLFAKRLDTLGVDLKRGAYASADAEERQLRQTLLSMVALDAKDPARRAQLVAAAEAAVAGNAEALDPAFRYAAFAAAVQDKGAPFMDALLARLVASDDPLFRRTAAQALGSGGTRVLAEKSVGFARDERLINFEKIYLIFALLQNPDTREFGYDHIVANFDYYQPLFSGFGNALIGIGSGFCSEEKAKAVDAALRPRLAKLGVGALDLDRSLATVRQCAALKAAKGAEISTALAAAR